MKAVFLGRFQPLHKGHHQVIEEYRNEYEEFIVAVGSSDKEEERDNPLSFEERKNIIRNCFPDIEVIGIEDEPRDEEGNRKWINKLVEQTEAGAIISQNDLVKRLVDEYTNLELVEQEIYDGEVYSGTEIRRRIRSGEEWRYLVPECAAEVIDNYLEKIKSSGIEYEFEPGWKRKNSYHSSYKK
jgi:nicotinamide-nucleotide adenylyltransferase